MREQAQRARYLESQLKLARSENTTLKVDHDPKFYYLKV